MRPHPGGPSHPGPGERDEQERPVPEAAGRAAERLHKQQTNVNKLSMFDRSKISPLEFTIYGYISFANNFAKVIRCSHFQNPHPTDENQIKT